MRALVWNTLQAMDRNIAALEALAERGGKWTFIEYVLWPDGVTADAQLAAWCSEGDYLAVRLIRYGRVIAGHVPNPWTRDV